MGVVVNTNAASIAASRILDANRHQLQSTMEKLSSGKRINSASDDAAGMAVAAKLRADVRSLNQSVRNANDAVSLVNTYDGASSEIESMLVRMRELAVQSTNGTYSSDDTALASKEFVQLQTEIDRISTNTTFNRQKIANASVSSGSFKFRVGPQNGTVDDVTVVLGDVGSSALGVSTSIVITNVTSASAAVSAIDTAISNLSSNRAVAGAFVNRLGHTIANLQNVSQRTQEALSGIEDTDYAAESAALARGTVLAQAGTAMLAQANQSPQYILALLKA